jgi:hypothetical protein
MNSQRAFIATARYMGNPQFNPWFQWLRAFVDAFRNQYGITPTEVRAPFEFVSLIYRDALKIPGVPWFTGTEPATLARIDYVYGLRVTETVCPQDDPAKGVTIELIAYQNFTCARSVNDDV